MKVKKLLFIIHSSAPSGGAEDDIENLLIKLKASGEFEVHGLLPDGPRKESFLRYLDRYGNLKWGVFPVINKGIIDYVKYFLKSFIQFVQIRRFIKGEKYDSALFSVAVLLWPVIFLKLFGFRNIVFVKETIEPRYLRRLVYKIISKCSVLIIPNSGIIENEFVKVTKFQNIKTVYSSVSKSEYDEAMVSIYEKRLGPETVSILKSGPLNLLMIGNLVKIKNPMAAVKAVELLNMDLDKSAKLFIAGRDDVEEKYSKVVKEYIVRKNLQDSVHLLGYQTKDVLEYLLKNVDYLIIPSLSEGVPLVLVYALKHKVPVLTTSAGGISDVVKDRINGIIIKSDASSISEAVKDLNRNPELKLNIKENGYRTFLEKFNLDRNLDEIVHLIKRNI